MTDNSGLMPCTLCAQRPILRADVATIGGNLKRLRARAKLQQGEVAEKVGVPQSQFSRWETDFATPDMASLLRVAPALHTTIDEIVAGVDEAYDAVLRSRLEAVARSHEPTGLLNVSTPDGDRDFAAVPLLAGRIAAGHPLVIEDHDIAEYLALPKTVIGRAGVTKPYCVRVGRDQRSMFPTIHPGATVLLDCADAKRERPTNGRIYAVNVDGGSTLKRVVVSGGVVFLSSDNIDKAEYPMREITSDDDHTELPSIIVGEAILSMNVLL